MGTVFAHGRTTNQAARKQFVVVASPGASNLDLDEHSVG